MSESPLTVPLRDLRKGPVARAWRIDDPRERFGELPALLSPVDVEVEVTGSLRDGVRARGRLGFTAHRACRKCLDEADVPVEGTLDVWYRSPSDVTPGEEGVLPLEPDAGEVDLTDAVREEIWVAVPEFWQCSAECAGLCPGCGARLSEEDCSCPPPEPDARWAALRDLAGDG